VGLVTLPTFRYHPDPLKSKVVAASTGPCPRCGLDRGLAYTGPVYAIEHVTGLCFPCIADGSAAYKWDLEFVNPYGPEPLDDAARRDELLHRTPGYFSAQGDPWPVHCADYCALLGPVVWDDISHIEAELAADLSRVATSLEICLADLLSDLKRPASPLWAHLFQCLGCSRHRLVADYE